LKKFMEDFKAFALKGNVFDMAVGMIIGAAFTTIVKSLVDDIIMPLIGLLTGGFDLTQSLKFDLNFFGLSKSPATLNLGMFLQNIINFLIIALSIFLFIRLIGAFHRKKAEEAPPAPPAKSDEVVLLEEINESLKKLAEEKERV